MLILHKTRLNKFYSFFENSSFESDEINQFLVDEENGGMEVKDNSTYEEIISALGKFIYTENPGTEKEKMIYQFATVAIRPTNYNLEREGKIDINSVRFIKFDEDGLNDGKYFYPSTEGEFIRVSRHFS
jgi:hypothetical protein